MATDKVFVNVAVPIERQVIVEVRHAGDLDPADVFAEAERQVRETIHDPAFDGFSAFWNVPAGPEGFERVGSGWAGTWQVEPNGLGEEITAYDYADEDADRIFAAVTLKEQSA